MNLLGSTGDPVQVAAALKPLIENAEDKALAELHASVVLAVTTLQQEIRDSREALIAELEQWRNMVDPVAIDAGDALTNVGILAITAKALLDRLGSK